MTSATPSVPCVRKFLDLATCHLPAHLMASMDPIVDNLLGSQPGVIAYGTSAGALMWVPDDPSDPDTMDEDIPSEILTVQQYARNHGCDYVLFDSDAPIDPNLPTWEW